ncbi:MAG: double-strand break repair helicase AddA [Planktomarina sp.]
MTQMNDATIRQIEAADPVKSTWLSANAGSGKTRVLTDRVARLLLRGVRPENILCLTYTKAAATEMQNRLFKRLGRWTMLEASELRAELLELGIAPHEIPDDLTTPRTLFATAIETPGGLKIQTIHSFCATLLRQFPLEAGISPQFQELDDRDQKLLMRSVLEAICDVEGPSPYDGVASEATGELDKFLLGLLDRSDMFTKARGGDAIWTGLGLQPNADQTSIIADCFIPTDVAFLDRLTADLEAEKSEKANPAKLKAVPRTMDAATFADLKKLWLTASPKDRDPYTAKIGQFPTKGPRSTLPYMHEVEDFMRRVEVTQQKLFLLKTAQRTLALETFAVPFLRDYTVEKSARGYLDFNDLIQKTRNLISQESVAAWVLYKLDGGIEHILVDEAQDTSPTQWEVVDSLTQEMTAGMGAGDTERTIFVVGDKKQSIYSFQGADPSGFDRMKEQFREKLETIEREFQDTTLDYSFRSSPAILETVDHVFAGENGLGGDAHHLAFKSDMPGRVDVWNFVEPTEGVEEVHWTDPVDLKSEDHHDKVLAEHLAAELKKMLATGTLPLKTDEGYVPRRIEPRDILILVQGRKAGLFSDLHLSLKAAGLPVSGADRLTVGEELAVKDLRALIEFLITPEDSYALACVLKSPLFGWGEADLFKLAAGKRDKFLWRELEKRSDDFPETHRILRDLRQKAEFFRPYELLEYILTDLHGRRKLIGRLGREAEEGIDAFVNLALSFEQSQVPSLTGFLVWLDVDELQVKRQLDGSHNEIRIMTVHGAKGLEAPIVILPQTGPKTTPKQDAVTLDENSPLWLQSRAELPNSLRHIDEANTQKAVDERDRLLYVALTRAESWLIVAGSGKLSKNATGYWFERVKDTLVGLGAADYLSPTGAGYRFETGDWPVGDPVQTSIAKPTVNLIDIPKDAAPAPDTKVKPINPSNLMGAKTLPGDIDGSPDALEHGTAVHLLLEHLPELDEVEWSGAAQGMLGEGFEVALNETAKVLLNPDFAFLFEPTTLAEVQVAGDFGGEVPLLGTIDRLVIADDHILIVDFKTNRVVPDAPEQTPIGVLRQLDAYEIALNRMYPDTEIRSAILWTHTKTLMHIPHHIVRDVSTLTPKP